MMLYNIILIGSIIIKTRISHISVHTGNLYAKYCFIAIRPPIVHKRMHNVIKTIIWNEQ